MRSGKFGSCSDFFHASVPRRGRQQVRLPAVLGSRGGRGVCRQVGVPGVRKAQRKVWERLADRKANSLAASTEEYLVCFVS